MKAIIGGSALPMPANSAEANANSANAEDAEAARKGDSDAEASKTDASLAMEVEDRGAEVPSGPTPSSKAPGADTASRPGNRPAFGAEKVPHLAMEQTESNATAGMLETPKRVAHDIARHISGILSGTRDPAEDLGPVTDETATTTTAPPAVSSQPLPTAEDLELVKKRAELMKQLQEIDAKLNERGQLSGSLIA